MNKFFIVFITLIVLNTPSVFARCGTNVKNTPIHDFVVNSTTINFKGSQIDQVEIFIKTGERYMDGINYDLPYICGDIWVRLKSKEKVVSSQSISTLLTAPCVVPSDFYFKEGDKDVFLFDDYNQDGQPDFSLRRNANASVRLRKLFTLNKSGKVSEIPYRAPADPCNGWIFGDQIIVSKGFIKCPYTVTGTGEGGISIYRWTGQSFEFVKDEQK